MTDGRSPSAKVLVLPCAVKLAGDGECGLGEAGSWLPRLLCFLTTVNLNHNQALSKMTWLDHFEQPKCAVVASHVPGTDCLDKQSVHRGQLICAHELQLEGQHCGTQHWPRQNRQHQIFLVECAAPELRHCTMQQCEMTHHAGI